MKRMFLIVAAAMLTTAVAYGEGVKRMGEALPAANVSPNQENQEARKASAVKLNEGDILVADVDAFGGKGGIIRVDPVTGAQTTVSSGGNFVDPVVVAIAANGDLFISDMKAFGGKGGVIRVDPTTGNQTTVSSGGNFVTPAGIAFAANGDLFVVDQNAFGGGGGIIRVNPVTGTQTIVSSGGSFVDPALIAVAANGDLIVTDQNAFGGKGGIIRVNPVTGAQMTVSSGRSFVQPIGIAIDKNGDFFVTDDRNRDPLPPALPVLVIRVNTASGDQTVISSGGSMADPHAAAFAANGDLFVVDPKAFGGKGGIIRVNPVTGAQTTVSSGGSFANPKGIAIVPAAISKPQAKPQVVQVILTKDASLFFKDEVYRQGKSGEIFSVHSWNKDQHKVYLLSTNEQGQVIALNVEDDAVISTREPDLTVRPFLFAIEDTEKFFESYVNGKMVPRKDVFETDEEYKKRIYPKFAPDAVRYFAVSDHSHVEKYDVEHQIMTFCAGWSIDKLTDCKGDRGPFVKILSNHMRSEYVGSNAYGAKIDVSESDTHEYVLRLRNIFDANNPIDISYSNFFSFETRQISSGSFNILRFRVKLPAERETAKRMADHLQLVIGVQPFAYDCKGFECRLHSRATFDSPSEISYFTSHLDANLVRVMLVDVEKDQIVFSCYP